MARFSQWLAIDGIVARMATTKRLKVMQALYLERDRTELLDALAADVRLPKAILLREAVDDLLVKYRMLKPNKRLALKAVR
jgi:Ribbon-helix-helix domain